MFINRTSERERQMFRSLEMNARNVAIVLLAVGATSVACLLVKDFSGRYRCVLSIGMMTMNSFILIESFICFPPLLYLFYQYSTLNVFNWFRGT